MKDRGRINRYAFALYAGASLFCMSLNLTGSALSDIMTDYQINLDLGGLMSFAQFMGGIAAILVLSVISDRLKKPGILIFAFALTGLMLLLIGAFPPYVLFMVSYLALGAGLGMIDTANNAVVSDLFQEKRNTMLCLLHGVSGIGAVIIPIAAALVGTGNWKSVYQIVAVIILAIAAAQGLFYGSGKQTIDQHTAVEKKKEKSKSEKGFFKDSKVWIALAAQLFYGASQTGITVWSVKYSREVFPDAGALLWALPISAYWLGTMIWRLMLGLVPALQKWASRPLVIAGGFLSGAALLPGVLCGNQVVFLISVFALGFFSGATLPRIVGLLTGWYPEKSGLATSFSFVASYLGFGVAPLIMGVIAANSGMTVMMLVPVFAAVLSGLTGIALPKERS